MGSRNRGPKCMLVLEDGFTLEGTAFAGEGEAYGEVVFNTSMTGYQEIITDPSYRGQLLAFTYPLIGNCGINPEDVESARPQVEAVIVREYCRTPSNWRSTDTLHNYLEQHAVLGVEGVDTRALTRHVREAGAMRAVLSTRDLDPESLLRKARAHPGIVGRDMVKSVTCSEEYEWNPSGGHCDRYRVVAFDFGAKRSILQLLADAGCHVLVVPAYTTAERVLELDPDGVFLSNGPGDPAGLPSVVSEVRKLLGRKPMFGICLGHQILGLAAGLTTFKLKFGHRGANHPVKNLDTGAVEITCQNHGFCVDVPTPSNDGSARGAGIRVTHLNLDDHTIEGMESRELGFFSVQYHPEASAGPHDSRYLFAAFTAAMDEQSHRRKAW